MVRAPDIVVPELLPGHVWKPADNSLLAANYPPRHIISGFAVTANFYFAFRVRIPANTVISNILMYQTVAGAGLTYGAVGVYEADGTQAGVSGDLISAMQTGVGLKTFALTTPVAAKQNSRWVWVVIAQAGATTVPQFGASSAVNWHVATLGQAVQPITAGYIAGASPLPATLTMSFTAFQEGWVGIK